MPCTTSGSPTSRPTRIRGFREPPGSWKMICISRRSARISVADCLNTGLPSKCTSPLVASSRRRIVRPTVVLPHPDSPTRPSVSPTPRSKLTPSTARTWSTVRWKRPRFTGKWVLRSLTSSSGRADESLDVFGDGDMIQMLPVPGPRLGLRIRVISRRDGSQDPRSRATRSPSGRTPTIGIDP